MNARHIVPFLTLPQTEFLELIELMQCSYGGSTVGLDQDRFDDWAPPIDVSIQLRVVASASALYSQLGFTAPTRVRLALLARCPNALYVKEIEFRDFDLAAGGGELEIELTGIVSGASISGHLIFDLVLIRLEDFEDGEAVLHSVAAGDILGRFEKRYDLEGEGSQFPTDVVRFEEDAELREYRNAPWILRTGGELDAQFTSTRWRLYLNADHPWSRSFEVLRAADPCIGAHLKRDIALALGAAVVEHGDSLSEEGEEGSLRWVLSRFKNEQCEKLFGTVDLEALREACLSPQKQSGLVHHFSKLGG
jgi:hypothetical protein